MLEKPCEHTVFKKWKNNFQRLCAIYFRICVEVSLNEIGISLSLGVREKRVAYRNTSSNMVQSVNFIS